MSKRKPNRAPSRRRKRREGKPPPYIKHEYKIHRDPATGHFASKGRVEQYISLYRLAVGFKTKAGVQRYEKDVVFRKKIRGKLLGPSVSNARQGLIINEVLSQGKIFSKIAKTKPKGILVKISGRFRGKKKDSTKSIIIPIDSREIENKKFLEGLIVGKVMRALDASGIRVSDRTVTRNKEFKFLKNPTIEVDYYG